MQTIEQLISAAATAQFRSLPKYAKDLIHDLAVALRQQSRYAEGIRTRAAKEVDELRVQLAAGPEHADTFMGLPRTLVGELDDDPEDRPLGTGTVIEYRGPEDGPGEGFSVSLVDGRLSVRGLNHLAVIPSSSTSLYIEKR
jgi:hypothetical protein